MGSCYPSHLSVWQDAQADKESFAGQEIIGGECRLIPGLAYRESTVFLVVIGKYIVFIAERVVDELPYAAYFFLSQNICGSVRF